MREGSKIENPRRYSDHTVEDLRKLLASGNFAQRDPRRANFYDIEGDANTYYVHVSPITGNVVLLAKWQRQTEDCYANSEHLVA